MGRTFSAAGPFVPWTISNSTLCPSLRLLNPEPLIAEWQARAARYPDALARAMVEQHLALPPWWSVPMLIERGDLPLVYGAFKEASERAGLKLLDELRAGLGEGDGELLGPAPLFRLRGKYRAQLVAKTDEPRRLAARTARLLAAAAPAMRRAGLTAVVDVDPQSL